MSTFSQMANPAWLLGLALVPLLVWLHHRPGRLPALTFSRLPSAAKGTWRVHAPFYLRLAALACLLVALARPQLGYAWEESLTEGIDIESWQPSSFEGDTLGVSWVMDDDPNDQLSTLQAFDPDMEMLDLTFAHVRALGLEPATYAGLWRALAGA